MKRSIDEQLFRKLMHLPRQMRGAMMREGMPPMGLHGPHGHGGPHGWHGHDDLQKPGIRLCGEYHPHRPGCGPHHPGFEHGGPHRSGCGHRGPGHPHPFARERVLTVLLDYEDGVRQKVLAEELHVNPSSMSEFINHLETGGYIVRTVDPSDKRATLISLTEKGTARAHELEDEKKEHFAVLFGNLTDEEKEELLRLLDKLMSDPKQEAE